MVFISSIRKLSCFRDNFSLDVIRIGGVKWMRVVFNLARANVLIQGDQFSELSKVSRLWRRIVGIWNKFVIRVLNWWVKLKYLVNKLVVWWGGLTKREQGFVVTFFICASIFVPIVISSISGWYRVSLGWISYYLGK